MAEPPTNVVIGRSRDCDLVLKDPTISGRHARLAWDDGKILVEDLGSANGTFVGANVAARWCDRATTRPGARACPGAPRRCGRFCARAEKTILGESILGSRFHLVARAVRAA
ncbi:MAG: FHA domain-containing protein [Polyangiales bacterium]